MVTQCLIHAAVARSAGASLCVFARQVDSVSVFLHWGTCSKGLFLFLFTVADVRNLVWRRGGGTDEEEEEEESRETKTWMNMRTKRNGVEHHNEKPSHSWGGVRVGSLWGRRDKTCRTSPQINSSWKCWKNQIRFRPELKYRRCFPKTLLMKTFSGSFCTVTFWTMHIRCDCGGGVKRQLQTQRRRVESAGNTRFSPVLD